MKKKPTHYNSASVHAYTYTAEREKSPNVLVSVGTFYAHDPICEFYVPITSVGKHGFISKEIISSRLKHDFNITIDRYTWVNK